MSGAAVIVGNKLIPAFAKKSFTVARVGSPARVDAASAQTAENPESCSASTAIPILLKPGGFVPKEISKSAGPYYFAFGNLRRSGVSLRMEREHGARIHEMNARNAFCAGSCGRCHQNLDIDDLPASKFVSVASFIWRECMSDARNPTLLRPFGT